MFFLNGEPGERDAIPERQRRARRDAHRPRCSLKNGLAAHAHIACEGSIRPPIMRSNVVLPQPMTENGYEFALRDFKLDAAHASTAPAVVSNVLPMAGKHEGPAHPLYWRHGFTTCRGPFEEGIVIERFRIRFCLRMPPAESASTAAAQCSGMLRRMFSRPLRPRSANCASDSQAPWAYP